MIRPRAFQRLSDELVGVVGGQERRAEGHQDKEGEND
jgi:hypothetical protein